MSPSDWQDHATQATFQQTTTYQHYLGGEAPINNEVGFGVNTLCSVADPFGFGNIPNPLDAGIAPNILGIGGSDYVYNVTQSGPQNNAARRISRAEWDRHKEVIVANYPDKTLPALQNFMSNVHGFDASSQQWKKKIREWNLGKNLSRRVARFVGKRAQSRFQEAGKKTNFTLGGHPIPIDKVKRHMQSYSGPSKSLTGSTPDDLTYGTYKSPAQLRTPVQAPGVQPDPFPGPATSTDTDNFPGRQDTEMGSNQGPNPLWNGQDLDDVLQSCRRAFQLATSGRYMAAKPIFMECLDGLQVLLTPTHATFLEVLEQYVSFAVRNQDLGEATERVHKFYNDHKERLGSHDISVWQCLTRLGFLYLKHGLTSQAFTMLINSRQGFQSATSGKPEDAYNCVHGTVEAIINIHMKHGEFYQAERELLNLITQADDLGESYRDDSRRHKRDLVHLYHTNLLESRRSYGRTAPNRNQMEKLLIEIVHFKSMSTEMTQIQMCCWDKLRSFYEVTGQRIKLENVLPELEQVYSRAEFVRPTDGSLPDFKYNMISSFQNLGQYNKAEWWLLRMRSETESQSFERISITMRLANTYFLQEKVDEAVQMLKEAQKLGKEFLDDDKHIFHSVISDSIRQKKMSQGCCPDCYVNPPGKETDRANKPAIHEFITSEDNVNPPVVPEALDDNDMDREISEDREEAEDEQGAENEQEAEGWEGCEDRDGDDDGEGVFTFSSIISVIDY